MEWIPISSMKHFSQLVDEAERDKKRVRTNFISPENDKKMLFHSSTPLYYSQER
jgi:hypothetical protein